MSQFTRLYTFALNRDEPGPNPLAAVLNLGKFVSLHVDVIRSTLLILYALITTWLNISQTRKYSRVSLCWHEQFVYDDI